MRAVAALLALVVLGPGARAQTAAAPAVAQDDPAIVACDAVLRHEFPVSKLRRSGGEIAQDGVTFVFSVSASATIFTRQCIFAHDASAGTWIVREFASPRDAYAFEASGSCHETEAWAGVLRRGGKPEQADLARSRLEECAALRQAAPDRKKDVAAENAKIAVRGATPVAASRTALRRP